jgi:signal transduction histidine kinase
MKKVFERVKPDSRIIIGYSSSLILLLLVYVVTLVANSKLKERTRQVEHTYQVILNLEKLLSKMIDAETGVRGFAITRNADFLEPYYYSERGVDSLHNELMVLTADNPVQQRRLAELKGLCDTRFTIFKRYLDYIRGGQVDTSFKVIPHMLLAKRTMTSLRVTAGYIQKDENELLAERDRNQKSTFASINTIAITSLLLTLILVIIGFVTYTNENRGRRIALENIKEYQEQLSRRIEELNTANSELLQMRSLEKFAATGRIARTIAHEVRNPLTNIDLSASQLKADVASQDEGLNYYFDVIERNSKRINKLISDLLQSTKFSELNFSNISITSLIDETLAIAKDRIELQQVMLEKKYDCNKDVLVDVEKMKIALLNIIINAIEAMQQGKGVLKVSSRDEGSNAVITLEDNGSGMDAEALGKLFEPYFTSKPNGNGLGLANTQNIIFNHKGNINVSSQPGQGSIFVITIPVG